MELYADATGCTVVAPPEETDAVLLGTAMVAAAAAGLHPDLRRGGDGHGAARHDTPPGPGPARRLRSALPCVPRRCTSSGAPSTGCSARRPDRRRRDGRRCEVHVHANRREVRRCRPTRRMPRRAASASAQAATSPRARPGCTTWPATPRTRSRRKLNVSRQAAQRLVAAAVAEGLITFRLDHPIARLHRARRGPAGAIRPGLRRGRAGRRRPRRPGRARGAAARQLEAHLVAKAPTVLAFGTGRTLRATVGQVAPMERPQHKVVSLVGTTTRDGRASALDVVMRLADRIGAACYPVPTTVVTDTVEERDLLAEPAALAADSRAGRPGRASPSSGSARSTGDRGAAAASTASSPRRSGTS